jgi:hypothetical protein
LIFRKIEVAKRKSGHGFDVEKLPQDATFHMSPDIVNVAASLFFSRYLIFIVVLKCHLKFRWEKM